MFELYQAATSSHQLLLTLLLILVVGYWALIIFGALDFDTDVPDDFNLDADGDGIPDLPLAHGSSSTGGAWLTAGRFLGFSQVPIVVWLSFMILYLWFGSLALNEWYNPTASAGQALLLFLPNLLVSLIVTKLTTIPVARLFAAMADADTEAEEVIGRTGTVVSMEVDETYGQLEINANGAPLLINVRTLPDKPTLNKGASAQVTSAGPDNVFYYIESISQISETNH
ncbi:MAG: DUF1449 family protein [Verrucomicrobia bacterium]|nr:DUF1449 family protein [Verrucomicrobiota bacterium]